MNPEAMQVLQEGGEQDTEKMLVEYLQELDARITALEEKDKEDEE